MCLLEIKYICGSALKKFLYRGGVMRVVWAGVNHTDKSNINQRMLWSEGTEEHLGGHVFSFYGCCANAIHVSLDGGYDVAGLTISIGGDIAESLTNSKEWVMWLQDQGARANAIVIPQ